MTRGEIEAVVTATGSGTFFGKTATLISNVDEMAHFEKVFQRINLSLTTLGVVIVTITFIMLVRPKFHTVPRCLGALRNV